MPRGNGASKLTIISHLVHDMNSLHASGEISPGLKDTNNNLTQPTSSVSLTPDTVSGARSNRSTLMEPTESSAGNQRTSSPIRGSSKLSYVTTRYRSPLPPKLSPLSKDFGGCTLSPNGTKLLWRDKRYMLIDINSGKVKDIDPKPSRFSLASLPSRAHPIIETFKVQILTTDASLLLARARTILGTFWMSGDRRTGEWKPLVRCSDPSSPACILSLSQNCALFVQINDKAEAFIIKVTKTITPEGKPKIKFLTSGALCRGNEVDQRLFTFSRVKQTISAVRHVEDSAILYTWKLHEGWFTDTGLSWQTPEPNTLLLPAYHGEDEIAIVSLVPGSSTQVLAIKFPNDTLPEDLIITGQEVPSYPSPPKQGCIAVPQKRAYNYSRVCSNWKGIISEDRELI
ncbi:uncharacterized protein BKA55DRAFT_345594 [Fusarium redolens]|uniref:Uncharacterized protein n=1 Tax=Fusarium redolens TaxID=48865 RepID=A0A9P9KE04_FUSRE|nr:uncharacterized protein BKA55DRAFT_345594 [Fusarium redolens]KAH7253845.1 hypothetical protein BKA55DRAFT_345594 [Fusarium redolens]